MFNGNLDYLFNALHDDNEPKGNTRDDVISLANFISDAIRKLSNINEECQTHNLKNKINRRRQEVAL